MNRLSRKDLENRFITLDELEARRESPRVRRKSFKNRRLRGENCWNLCEADCKKVSALHNNKFIVGFDVNNRFIGSIRHALACVRTRSQ